MPQGKILSQYVNDLRKLPTVSELPEKKALIWSFVQRIGVVGDEATLTYEMPLNGLLEQKTGVCLLYSMVGDSGFEPLTSRLSGARSNQLS